MNHVIKLQPQHYELAYEHLCRLSAEDRRYRFNSCTSDQQLKNYMMLWNKPENHLYGIIEDNKVIAFMHIAEDYEYPDGWEIGVSVDFDKQGQGLGTELLNFSKKLAVSNNWKTLTFRYAESNKRLFSLCRNTGFHTEREGSEYLSYYDVNSCKSEPVVEMFSL